MLREEPNYTEPPGFLLHCRTLVRLQWSRTSSVLSFQLVNSALAKSEYVALLALALRSVSWTERR